LNGNPFLFLPIDGDARGKNKKDWERKPGVLPAAAGARNAQKKL
jgi:hypothetical protein